MTINPERFSYRFPIQYNTVSIYVLTLFRRFYPPLYVIVLIYVTLHYSSILFYLFDCYWSLTDGQTDGPMDTSELCFAHGRQIKMFTEIGQNFAILKLIISNAKLLL